jgi:hypothetical protein
MGIPAGASATVLESKDRARFLALDKDDKRFSVLNRPRLTVNPLAIGTLYVGETLSYVKSYKLETVQPGDVKMADPEIGRIDEGLELRAQAALLDAQKVSISLEASTTAVRRPIPTKSFRLAPEIPTEVTVSTPEVERKSVQARCTLGPDATVAFCAPCAGNNEREFLILLSARAQTAAELQAPKKSAR